MVAAGSKGSQLGELDAVQRRVATATGSQLLLGGAGTGKTTALASAAVTAAGRDGAHAVLGLARNRDAARLWQSRAARAEETVAPPVQTVAALAGRIVADAAGAAEPPRILTAPEQEMRVRELLRGSVETGSVAWPAEWKPALATRAFAGRLRRCIAHARRLGWEAGDLARLAAQRDDAGWQAIAGFLGEYLEVLDWEGALDHVEVVLRAARIVEAGVPTRFAGLRTILADDVHEWDLAQARLVLALAGSGKDLVAAADPDQCTGSYRGADLAALTLVRRHVGETLTCPIQYRGPAAARDARRSLLDSRWYAGLPAAAMAAHRTPAVVGAVPGAVVAMEFDDAHAQARHIAARLRERHAAGVAWREMAVLASSPRSEIPSLARGLAQSGIPVFVATADVALAEQAAVATLVTAAQLCLDGPGAGAQAGETFERLLTSDMVAVLPRDLRRLRRWWRQTRGDASLPVPPDSAAGVGPDFRRMAEDHELAVSVGDDLRHVVSAVRGLGDRLRAARAAQSADATPAEVLWELWVGVPDEQGRSWPERLRQRSLGSRERALAADRDLDAVIQLFRLAERAPQRWGGRRALAALLDEIEHQEIPAEPDLSARSGADAVEVLSLHRAQGRSWRVAVVTGLTSSVWDGGELGAGIAPPQRLSETDLLPVPPPQRAAEQRRLFNVALSRGDELLVLAACGGPSDPPTGFLADAGLEVAAVSGPPQEPQTAVDLMLRLRAATGAGWAPATAGLPGTPGGAAGPRRPGSPATRVGRSTVSPTTSDATAALAAMVAARNARGGPLFPGMQPQHWPGARAWSIAPRRLRRSGPVTLSGSAVAAIADCPMRWFLQREARGDRPSGVPAQFGLAVHAAAADLVRAGRESVDVPRLIGQYWTGAGYDAGWHESQERALAEESLQRAWHWLATRSGAVSAEVPLDQAVAVVDEQGAVVDSVRIRGWIDLTETRDGERLVWDLKTARAVPSLRDVAANPQLAVYQLALREQPGPPVTGAGLVHLCVPEGRDARDRPATRQQPGVDTDTAAGEHAMSLLRRAVGVVRGETFSPTPGPGCRTCPFTASCPAKHPRARGGAPDRVEAVTP